jgi:sec-independent protein translocase protein TatC
MLEDLRPHLVELRKRLTISVVAFIIIFMAMFTYNQPLLTWMTAPLHDALVDVGKISPLAAKGMMTTNQVGGAFFVAMKVSFFAAIVAALPIILSQIWLFIAPGLYSNEKKMLIPFVFGGTFMFAVGVAFAYYVVTPFGFTFLITFGSFTFTPMINIEDYVGFFTKIMFGFGVAFELPIFAYFLALLGFITDRTLIDFFRYAVVLIFIIAALLTPPDVMTQLLMAFPLIILYGISILIVRFVNPASKLEEEKEDDTEEEKEEEKEVEENEQIEQKEETKKIEQKEENPKSE